MSVLDFIFPKSCLECKTPGKYLCSSCLQKVRRARTHRLCKERQGLDGAFSVWQYKGVIRKAILGLKYRFASEIAKELAGVLASEIKKRPLQLNKAVLVPIPLHPRRKRWRGFNQSEEIGKILAQSMGWNFAPRLLKRKIAGIPQIELKGKARRENVRGVFAVNSPKLPISHNMPFILFDDVWTTGSTIKEAARMLKREGARSVWALTISRSR